MSKITKKEFYKHIGHNMYTQRILLNFSQAETAKYLGRTSQQVQLYEVGSVRQPLHLVYMLFQDLYRMNHNQIKDSLLDFAGDCFKENKGSKKDRSMESILKLAEDLQDLHKEDRLLIIKIIRSMLDKKRMDECQI